MGIHADADHTHLVIRLPTCCAVGKGHDFIANDFSESPVIVAVEFFDRVSDTVVSQSTDVAAVCCGDLVKQLKLCIATIGHIQSIGLDDGGKNSTLIEVTASIGGHIDSRGDGTKKLEVRMQSPLHHPAAGCRFAKGSLHNAWQSGNQ